MAMYRPKCKAIVRAVWGPLRLYIIMANKRPPCKAIVRAVLGIHNGPL
jgi:hypothetical protein